MLTPDAMRALRALVEADGPMRPYQIVAPVDWRILNDLLNKGLVDVAAGTRPLFFPTDAGRALIAETTCGHCWGSGRTLSAGEPTKPCPACNGSGVTAEADRDTKRGA